MSDDGTTATTDGASGATAAEGNSQLAGAAEGQGTTAPTPPVESLLGVSDAPTKTNPEGTPKDGDGTVKPEEKAEEKAEEKPEDKNTDNKPITLEDLKIPEGKAWDEETGKGFLDLVNDTSLSRGELTQKLIDMYSGLQDKIYEGEKAAHAAQREADEAAIEQFRREGLEQCKKDPEIGGQKWEENKALIKKGSELLHPALQEHFRLMGMDTDPGVAKTCLAIAKLMGEDPGASGKMKSTGEDPLVAMYRKSLEG